MFTEHLGRPHVVGDAAGDDESSVMTKVCVLKDYPNVRIHSTAGSSKS